MGRAVLAQAPLNPAAAQCARTQWRARLVAGAAALGIAIASSTLTSGQKPEPSAGVLDEHPSIQ